MTDSVAVPAHPAAPHLPSADAWWRTDRSDIHPAATRFDTPIFAHFAALARRQPDAVAVRSETGRIGFAALHDRALALAARLAAAAPPGAAIATLLADPIEAACAMLACLASGRPCIPLNPHNPAARLADILADAGAAGLVLSAPAPCPLPPGLAPIPLHAPLAGLTAAAPAAAPGTQDAPFIVIYTSGSTGRPKGIVRSQRQMLARVFRRIRQFALSPDDRMLLLYPLSTGPGVSACLCTLLSGAALHVADVAAIGARGVLDIARTSGVTTVTAVPVLLRMLFAVPEAAGSFATLRSVYTASEALLRQDIDRWRAVLPPDCRIQTAYGLTEGAPLADWFVSREQAGQGARLPVGVPVSLHDFAITGPDGAPVAPGESGEFWARGRLLSLGEWRQGRCVPGRLLADPDDPAGAILRTGDLVRRRPDGLLDFMGRLDDQIRIRGNRVEPAELEHVLRLTPGVADAAILARRTAGDPVVVAFVVPAGAEDPRLAAAQRLRDSLPPYMQPARLHAIAAVPKLSGGKIDAAALARLDDAALP